MGANIIGVVIGAGVGIATSGCAKSGAVLSKTALSGTGDSWGAATAETAKIPPDQRASAETKTPA